MCRGVGTGAPLLLIIAACGVLHVSLFFFFADPCFLVCVWLVPLSTSYSKASVGEERKKKTSTKQAKDARRLPRREMYGTPFSFGTRHLCRTPNSSRENSFTVLIIAMEEHNHLIKECELLRKKDGKR